MSDLNAPAPHSLLRRRRALQLGIATLAAPALIRPASAATITVHLSQVESLTGPSAAYGIRGQDGVDSAVRQLTREGGFHDKNGRVYNFKVSIGDMANDARQAITLFRQAALDSSVVAMVGPTNSVGMVPMVPIASQLHLMLMGEGGAPVKKWNPWAFRVDPIGATAIPILLKTVVGKLKIKRLAVIYDQTQDAQAGDAAVCRAMKGKLGYDLVVDEAFSTGIQDFSPQISRIKAAKPDAIFCAAATGDGVRLTAQIRAAGLDVPLMTGYGAFDDPTYWNGSKGAIKGGYTWLAQDLAGSTGALRAWFDDYNKSYKLPPTSFSTYGYDSIMCLAEVIKQTSSTERGVMRDAMAHLDYHSPIGTHVRFNNPPSGENLSPTVAVIQITGPGQYVVVT